MKLAPLLIALALAVPAAAAPARPVKATKRVDWTATVAATPEGGFRMGNPAAKVKLVEYASLTCPHCRDFHAAAMKPLKAYIATGTVSYEFRNFVLNGPDYGASLLARCDGPAKFFARADALFVAQPEWTRGFVDLDPAVAERLRAQSPQAQVAGLAKAGGLDTFMMARGMAAARIDQCLANPAEYDRLATMRGVASETYGINGTPGFILNGKQVTEEFLGQTRPVLTWEKLEPRLQQALR